MLRISKWKKHFSDKLWILSESKSSECTWKQVSSLWQELTLLGTLPPCASHKLRRELRDGSDNHSAEPLADNCMSSFLSLPTFIVGAQKCQSGSEQGPNSSSFLSQPAASEEGARPLPPASYGITCHQGYLPSSLSVEGWLMCWSRKASVPSKAALYLILTVIPLNIVIHRNVQSLAECDSALAFSVTLWQGVPQVYGTLGKAFLLSV